MGSACCNSLAARQAHDMRKRPLQTLHNLQTCHTSARQETNAAAFCFRRVLYLNLQRACNEWRQLEQKRGREGEGGLGAACLPGWLACGCNCHCNWESHELCKHWRNPQSFSQSDSVFPGSVDKQTNCLLLSLGGTTRSRHSSGLGAVKVVDGDEVAEEISSLED